jgi:hypothetical protein
VPTNSSKSPEYQISQKSVPATFPLLHADTHGRR